MKLMSKFIYFPWGKFRTSFFHCCDVGLFGGYFGTVAKLGPFASRDSCAGVRRVLDRLITHFCLVLLELMYVCLEPLGLWLGATESVVDAQIVGAEGAGAMGAAGVEELPLALDLVLELLDGRCECLLKVTLAVLMLLKFSEPLGKL